VWQCVAMCCSGVQWGAVGCSGVQWGAVWCSVVQFVAAWCNVVRVLQSVAVCCRSVRIKQYMLISGKLSEFLKTSKHQKSVFRVNSLARSRLLRIVKGTFWQVIHANLLVNILKSQLLIRFTQFF